MQPLKEVRVSGHTWQSWHWILSSWASTINAPRGCITRLQVFSKAGIPKQHMTYVLRCLFWSLYEETMSRSSTLLLTATYADWCQCKMEVRARLHNLLEMTWLTSVVQISLVARSYEGNNHIFETTTGFMLRVLGLSSMRIYLVCVFLLTKLIARHHNQPAVRAQSVAHIEGPTERWIPLEAGMLF